MNKNVTQTFVCIDREKIQKVKKKTHANNVL